VKLFAILVGILLPFAAQAQPSKPFVGTVVGLRVESAALEVKPDSGDVVIAQLTSDTIAQKIAPGEKDLKKAETIEVTDLAKGDRVLVTLEPDSTRIRRIVVMSAKEIASRNDADRLDWQKRGVAGIVSAKSGNQITVRNKTLTGEVQTKISVSETTAIKRYAPDSVKFADAQPSKLAEISVGDQVRARGQKSADGLTMTAQDVVFGTFLIEAGAIAAIDPEARQMKVKELGTNKLLTVKLTADSQIKQMFAMPAMAGRGGFPAAPSGGSGAGMRPGGGGAGMPAGGNMAGRGPGGAPGGFDINQMIEHIPAVKLEDLKPGATVVITSTKGAKSGEITAILVLSNADMLIQMASAMQGPGRGAGAAGMTGMGMGGMNNGDLSGLMGLGIGGMNQ
jgi:hypothetical protein